MSTASTLLSRLGLAHDRKSKRPPQSELSLVPRFLAAEWRGAGRLGRRAWPVDVLFAVFLVRQWVLSLPIPLRFTLARQPGLRRAVLRTFLRVVFRWYQRRAESEGVSGGQEEQEGSFE